MSGVAKTHLAREMAARRAFDARKLRGMLAENRVKQIEFARACGLHHVYVCQILTGAVRPGELARIKIAAAVQALGLDETDPSAA